DGRTLAVGTGNHQGTVWLLEAGTGKRVRTLTIPGAHVTSLAFAADGRTLASGQGKDVRLWDVATGATLQTVPGGSEVHQGGELALSPDGRVIACGGPTDGAVRLWDAATGKELRSLPADRHAVYAVAFSPDGQTLASAGSVGAVTLWDVA